MYTIHAGRFALAASVLVLCAVFPGSSAAQSSGGKPETVMVTCHAKPGSEAELARVLTRHWTALRNLKLVRDAPHLTLRGIEDGDKTYFVEIFTWRDASIPDAAPPPIQAIWAEMGKLVEPRGGRPGIDIVEVAIVGQVGSLRRVGNPPVALTGYRLAAFASYVWPLSESIGSRVIVTFMRQEVPGFGSGTM